MVIAVMVVSFLALWAGTALMLDSIPWFRRQRRRSLEDRLRPFSPDIDPTGTKDVQRWMDAQWAARHHT